MRPPPDLITHLARQTPKSLFKVLNKLPRFGIGRKLTRDVWGVSNTGLKAVPHYWTIKRVVPSPDLKRGVVYGSFSWRGKPGKKTARVTGDLHSEWKLLPRDF